ncbi:MAG: hypothetical protein U0694_03920 [Anaerolineae bacterium]
MIEQHRVSVGTGELEGYTVFQMRKSLTFMYSIFMVVLAGLALMFVVLIPAALREPEAAQYGLLLVIVMLLFAYAAITGLWLLYQIAYRSYVATSAQGIKFRGYGITGETTWDNVTGLTSLGYGRARQWGLTVKTPMNVQRHPLFNLFFYMNPVFYNRTAATLISLGEYAPESRFNITVFLTTQLGQEIVKYAPHLFETPKPKWKV